MKILSFLLCTALLLVEVKAQRFVKTFSNIAAMAAANPNDVHTQAIVEGYSTPQDGGGGMWMWIEGDGTAADGGCVIASTNPSAKPGRWKRNFSGAINVRWFGALGNGANQTTAIKAAYDAINKDLGGTLYFPAGDYVYNLVVTNRNITLEYDTSVKDGSNNRSRPNNATQPVVQIGDGSSNCRGYRIKGGSFIGPNTAGSVGIALRSGAIGGELHSVNLAGFHTNFFALGDGFFPASTCRIYGGEWQSGPVDNGRCIYVATPPDLQPSGDGYTTDYTWYGTHINGNSLGTNNYTIEIDNTFITLDGMYVDMPGDNSIKLSRTTGSNTASVNPWIQLYGVSLDLFTLGHVVKTFNNDRNITRILKGLYNIQGTIELLDGTELFADMGAQGLGDASIISNPYLAGAIHFIDPTVSTNYYTERNMLIYRSGNAFTLENLKDSGTMTISATNGITMNPYNGALTVNASIIASDATDPTIFSVRHAGSTVGMSAGTVQAFIKTTSNHDLVLGANNTDRQTILKTGDIEFENIGFHGASPSTIYTKNTTTLSTLQNFEAKSSTDATIFSTRIGGATTYMTGGGAAGYLKTLTAHSLIFGANNADHMILNTNGQFVVGNVNPPASAALTVDSVTRGFLPPRMSTAERDAISGVVDGLILYNHSVNKLQVRAGGAWVDLH